MQKTLDKIIGENQSETIKKEYFYTIFRLFVT